VTSRVLFAEGVEHRLALAGGVNAPFDAEARQQILEAEAAEITPIEPTMDEGSTMISSAAQASQ
jgi:hypothetical protein